MKRRVTLPDEAKASFGSEKFLLIRESSLGLRPSKQSLAETTLTLLPNRLRYIVSSFTLSFFKELFC